MPILVRKEGGAWKKVDPQRYSEETHLQKLLYESPELVSGGKAVPSLVFTREASLPGSGRTDLIGVDSEGGVYIVECKLASNSDARRKVLGQILEYAAYLCKFSYDDLDELFLRREEKSLEEIIRVLAPPTWSFEGFRRQVEKNLTRGAFNLVIVVDQINEELRNIIDYVSSRGDRLSIKAIELPMYLVDEVEILVPHIREGQGFEGSTPKRSVAEALAEYAEPQPRARVERIISEWEKLDGTVEAGRTVLSFRADVEGTTGKIFGTFPEGILSARPEGILRQGGPPEAVAAYREELARLPAFTREKALKQGFPGAKLEDMSDTDILEFIHMSDELVQKWREACRRAAA